MGKKTEKIIRKGSFYIIDILLYYFFLDEIMKKKKVKNKFRVLNLILVAALVVELLFIISLSLTGNLILPSIKKAITPLIPMKSKP